MQRRWRRPQGAVAWGLGISLLLVTACDEHIGCAPVLSTEQGQLELLDRTVIAGPCVALRSPGPVLVGTRMCPRIDCGRDVPGCEIDDDERLPPEDVVACFDQSVEGPAMLDGDCLQVTGPGEVTWSFTTRDCPAQTRGYAPQSDRLSLPTVDASELTGHLESPGDAFALRQLHPGDTEAFDEDAALQPGEVATVVAEAAVPLAAVLRHPAHQQAVAWNPQAWTVEVVDAQGGSPVIDWDIFGIATVTMPAGAEATLAVTDGTTTIEIGRVRSVDASEIASLEVVVGYVPDDDSPDGHGVPVGARAIARTSDGTAVYGLPVQWEVTDGAFPVWRDADRPGWGADYVALIEEDGATCHAPPEKTTDYAGTLVARYGELEAETDLTWRVPGQDESFGEVVKELFTGEDYEKSDRCQGPGFPEAGCTSCSQGSPGSAFALVIVVVGLRRRRSRARTV